ncbi:phage baseplate protein [Pseudomonas aeruginosa]|uniref:GPW/gp25 family protein n=1 Tax=Pseudomonas aeruginosa TaxID=287 RepID=UPI003D2CF956|nr:phage baseplate protein [Pseudomonas aeruginosa]MCO2762784.1 phage baseplate protein [Pseudomonas aeruginosa]MCO2768931.1 phage baseplate protein [Pseudomonas aeruginosa]HBO5143992.1 GPW/gp25 family protein [Pseudomonas aeruginosa]
MSDAWSGLYGRGWGFPLEFDAQGPVMVQDERDIAQSLEILFRTEPGERIMRPDYGGGLEALLFENISEALLAELRTHIADAVAQGESRADLDDLIVEQVPDAPNCLRIQVSYRLPGLEQVEALSIEWDMGNGLSTVRRLGGRYA